MSDKIKYNNTVTGFVSVFGFLAPLSVLYRAVQQKTF